MATIQTPPQLQEMIAGAESVLIGTARDSSEALSAAIGMSELLGAAGKSVTVATSGEITQLHSSLPGHEKVVSSVTKNFVVSLRNAVGNVEKVSYYTEGSDLHLVIHPKPSAPAFSQDNVYYSDSSSGFDLVIVLGAGKLEDLGEIYQEEPSLYSKDRIVNITHRSDASQFGQVNMVAPDASSVSELVVFMARDLGMQITTEAATGFLAGLDEATDEFQSPRTTADAFEAASICMHAGGRRIVGGGGAQRDWRQAPARADQALPQEAVSGQPAAQTGDRQQPAASQAAESGQTGQSSSQPQPARTQSPASAGQADRVPRAQPQAQPHASTPQQQPQQQPESTSGQSSRSARQGPSQTESAQTRGEQQEGRDQEDEDSDWLQPKIYKGGQLL